MSNEPNENNDILTIALSLAGESADEDVMAALCDAASAELEARLREGENPETLGSVFSLAAGVLAVSMYCAVGQPEQIRSFKAGSVSVEYGGGEATPESLRAAAEAMLAAHLKDRGFDFMGVRG